MHLDYLAVFAALVVLVSCASAPAIVLAFPHGGDAGADGIAADAAATAYLEPRGYRVEHVDLDSGVVNPHEDEGTDDERAVQAVRQLAAAVRDRGTVRGLIVGPTRAIADAVPRLPVPIVAVAPLTRHVRCACDREAELRRRDPSVVIETVDGAWWVSASGRFRTLAAAASGIRSFDVVNRRGAQYHVPAAALRALLRQPGAIDLRGFSAHDVGLIRKPEPAVAARSVRAAQMLLEP